MTEERTHAKAETFCGMFEFQASIFRNALDNLSDEVALKRVAGQSNHMNWLLGHIVHCRYMLAGMIGLPEREPFDKVYWSAIEPKAYPAIAEVVSKMTAISEKLIEKLGSLSDEEITGRTTPDKPSLADIISFFSYHEAYHLGQVGMVRKLVGLGSLKSN